MNTKKTVNIVYVLIIFYASSSNAQKLIPYYDTAQALHICFPETWRTSKDLGIFDQPNGSVYSYYSIPNEFEVSCPEKSLH